MFFHRFLPFLFFLGLLGVGCHRCGQMPCRCQRNDC